MSAVDAFWLKVDKNGPIPDHVPEIGACWIWTASVDSHGYGHLGVGGKTQRAHRVAFELKRGSALGSYVLHRCDNRRCVRPSHLFLGTHLDNMRDMVRKGRLVPAPSGERHNRAKLTPEKVLQIRALCAAGESKASVARKFGVWPRAIWMIIEGGSWASVR